MTPEEAADSIDNSYFAKMVEDEITYGDSAVDNELDGETEGVNTDTSHMVRDSLIEALEATAEDAASQEDEEETAQRIEDEKILATVPKVPKSLGGGDDTDENGLVYLTYTFTVDPSEYRSNHYRPIPNAQNLIKEKMRKMKANGGKGGGNEEIETSETIDEEFDIGIGMKPKGKGKPSGKTAMDEAPFGYASTLDGSSCWCMDEAEGVDFSVVAMDISPHRAPTRQTCQTDFDQCRAENPLFCRFHGPKLLETDIRDAVRAHLRAEARRPNGISGAGIVISVTKDRDSANPMAFRLTVGCTPVQKPHVEQVLRQFLHNTPGISTSQNLERTDSARPTYTQEFEMDILSANRAPYHHKHRKAAARRDRAVASNAVMETVGETPPARPPRQQRARQTPQAAPQTTPPTAEQQPAQQPQPTAQPAPPSDQRPPTEDEIQRAAESIARQFDSPVETVRRDFDNALGQSRDQYQSSRDIALSLLEARNTLSHFHPAVFAALNRVVNGEGNESPAPTTAETANATPSPEQPQSQNPAQGNGEGISRPEASSTETSPTDRQTERALPSQQHSIPDNITEQLIRDAGESLSEHFHDSNEWIDDYAERIRRYFNPAHERWHSPDRYYSTDRIGDAREDAQILARQQQREGHTRFQPLIDALNSLGEEGVFRNEQPSADTPPIQPQSASAEENNGNGNDEIEHLEGGVKARFSPSEVAAIEREMGNAIRYSREHPEDAEAKGYAHALSHFLGSANSAHGRRNNVARGIRDNITKAELLEKAERRLADTVDADHPERYNGSVRALQKIAELSGIGELQIDGTNVSLSDPAQESARPPRQEEPDLTEALANAFEDDTNRQQPAPHDEPLDLPPPDNEDVLPAPEDIGGGNAIPSDEEMQSAVEAFAANNALARDMPRDILAGALAHVISGEGFNENPDAPNDHGSVRRIAAQNWLNGLPAEGHENVRRALQAVVNLPTQPANEANNAQNETPLPADLENIRERAEEEVVETPNNNEEANPPANNDANAHQVPTAEQIESTARAISPTVGAPVARVVEELNNRLSGRTPVSPRELSMLRQLVSQDDPVLQALTSRREAARERMEQSSRPIPTQPNNITSQSSTSSSGTALRNPSTVTIPPPNRTVTAEELERIRAENAQFWASNPPILDVVRDMAVINRNPAVAAQDLDTARDAFGRRTIHLTPLDSYGTYSQQFNPASSQVRGHGCNCWKTVASTMIRMRGFNVKARTQDDRSPVFAGTMAEGGQQKSTFAVSQKAMAEHYEMLNPPYIEGAREAIKAKLKKMAEGDADGHPPIAPYPDGTMLATWNGGHCTGALLYKGKWLGINPYYGGHWSVLTEENIACNTFGGGDSGWGGTYRYEVREALADYRRQKAVNPRFKYGEDPAGQNKKMKVFHFLRVQKRLKKDNPNVTDDEVLQELTRDEQWIKMNGSWIVRPDQPLIKEMFGLAALQRGTR